MLAEDRANLVLSAKIVAATGKDETDVTERLREIVRAGIPQFFRTGTFDDAFQGHRKTMEILYGIEVTKCIALKVDESDPLPRVLFDDADQSSESAKDRAKATTSPLKRKLQVFVSSTYEDMKDERQAAVEVILQAGHIPAGMELFSAGDESQMDTIRQWIDDSDVFMLILGGRYGTIEEKSGKSYIELEYDHAITTKKPFFAIVIDEKYLEEKIHLRSSSVFEKKSGHLMIPFKEKVKQKMCSTYGNLDQLKLMAFRALADMSHRNLRGWVRGDEAIDATATLKEIERLQNENGELRTKMQEMQSSEMALGMPVNLDAVADILGAEATQLLTAAALSDGRITFAESMGDARIYAGEKFQLRLDTHRKQAIWRAAINELIRCGAAEAEGISCTLTNLGYQLSDVIVASQGQNNPSEAAK